MKKKILSAVLAAVLLLAATATAFAAPDETAAPANTTAPTATAAPVDNGFLDQIKAMRADIQAMRDALKTEISYDQQMRSDIRSLKGIVATDKTERDEYQKQMSVLTSQLRNLNKQLKEAKHPKNKKHKDQATIEQLQAEIATVKQQISDLKAKYKPLLDQIKDNNLGRRSLKPLRQQLQPEYVKLKPLFAAAKGLNKDITALTKQLKAAVNANDLQTAESLVGQITDKVNQLKDDINQRIAIRLDMRTILDDYKASIKPITIT